MRTPSAPCVVTRTRTRLSTSPSLQPVFCSSRPFSYSFVNRYDAPSTSRRMSSPCIRAICWDGSAAKSYPRSRHSSVCRIIASGSSAAMQTRSKPPTRSCTGASSISRASAIAPV